MTPAQESELQEIGREIIRWLPHDRAYVTCLVAFAKGQGLLTDSQALEAKGHIDEFYKGDDTVKANRAKYMGKVLERIGFMQTKVLWRLIDQMPSRRVNDQGEFEPDHKKIYKGLHLQKDGYFKVIDALIDYGYLYKVTGQPFQYRIDFEQIMAEGNEIGVTL